MQIKRWKTGRIFLHSGTDSPSCTGHCLNILTPKQLTLFFPQIIQCMHHRVLVTRGIVSFHHRQIASSNFKQEFSRSIQVTVLTNHWITLIQILLPLLQTWTSCVIWLQTDLCMYIRQFIFSVSQFFYFVLFFLPMEGINPRTK